MEDTVARKPAIAAMKRNVLVMIGTKKSVKIISNFLERKIADIVGLLLIVESMAAGNLVVYVVNGATDKYINRSKFKCCLILLCNAAFDKS